MYMAIRKAKGQSPPPRTKRNRIVIADDHSVLRESLAALLSTQPDFQVVGKAANGREALELVQLHRPDLLVLDLAMPDGDGFEVLRTLDRGGHRVASIVLTGSDAVADYAQVVRLGARGLVLKGDRPEVLFNAIRSVANGELGFTEEMARQILGTMTSEAKTATTAMDRLSSRERQIAFLVARGLRNRHIAEELSISENTVKRHLQSIFGKTGARDRLELAVMALNEAPLMAAPASASPTPTKEPAA
jgi:two-component system, NarL family, nitrate/nitrite response regulator NarL